MISALGRNSPSVTRSDQIFRTSGHMSNPVQAYLRG